MEPFTNITALAAPLPAANIDTDVIFPARFLLITQKKGLGRYAFAEWATRADGTRDPDFVLNRPQFAGAPILIAGDNFGGGSSREHAPWALRDLGIRCVISSSFGEIFYSNCFKNGMLPVRVSPDQLADLMTDAEAGQAITVDLVEQRVSRTNGETIAFAVEPWRRLALLNGWDEIAIILNEEAGAIAAFEQTQRGEKPWLFVEE